MKLGIDVWWWVGFNAFVLALLVLDLGVFHRKAHEVKPKEAAIWSVIWVTLSLLFNGFIWYEFGSRPATEFLTGYLIEKSLSVDNLFVFVLIFSYFNVPAKYQHRILFWGIIGALIMRATLIGLGAFILEQFEWAIYIFGAFLVYTGIRMAAEKESNIEIEANPLIKLLKRWIPVSNRYHEDKFLVKENGVWILTPMMIVLVLIESTDLVFALDSIPAIFAITQDSFIVYTSNIFAILGLRSLYFLLANVIDKFHYLKYGLAVVLCFIGVKMLLTYFDFHIDIAVSLGIVAVILIASVIFSITHPKEAAMHSPVTHDPSRLTGPIAPFDLETQQGNGSSTGANDAPIGNAIAPTPQPNNSPTDS